MGLQLQVDGLVSHFADEAVNPTTLAAMMAGGMAYRLGRIGVLSSVGAQGPAPLRMASVLIGLGSEVTAFEFTNRSLIYLRERAGLKPAPTGNLWNWSGRGGWREGWLQSFLTFGILKGAGHLAREENMLFQHAFQDGAMVAGHQTASLFGLSPRPEGSLAEQLFQAEATNLQLGAGRSLVHSMAPGIFSLEKSLDLSLRSSSSFSTSPLFESQWAFTGLPMEEIIPRKTEEKGMLWMAAMDDDRGSPQSRGRVQRLLDWILSKDTPEEKPEETQETQGPYRSAIRTRPELDLLDEHLLLEAEPYLEEALRLMENRWTIPPEILRRFKILPALESAILASQDPMLPVYFSSPDATQVLTHLLVGHNHWLWGPHPQARARYLALLLEKSIRGAVGVSIIHARLHNHQTSNLTFTLRNIAESLIKDFQRAAQGEGIDPFPIHPHKALEHPTFHSQEIRDVHHDFFRSPLLEMATLQDLSRRKLENQEAERKEGGLEFFSERVSGEARFGFRKLNKKDPHGSLLLSGARALEWFFSHPDPKIRDYARQLYQSLGQRLILNDPELQHEFEGVLSNSFPQDPGDPTESNH
jgi:hypothetical protein